MKVTRLIWDMPVTVKLVDRNTQMNQIENIFVYFKKVDEIFSIFNPDSEMSKINLGKINKSQYSAEMKEVLDLCEKTKNETNGYFDIGYDSDIDPLGLVKGWAIHKAAVTLRSQGINDFFIDAGGDVEIGGLNKYNKKWRVGIRNPFNRNQIVKTLELSNMGIATSGTYIRGEHIIDPIKNSPATELVSLTVVADNVFEADRFATAAFAMGKDGIRFISSKKNLEGYAIDKNGMATFTPGFSSLTI